MVLGQTEVAVIGGGSTGASILFHLAKNGIKNCTLLEKRQIAGGQTSRSAAIIRTHYSHPTLVKMAVWSYRFFEHFEEKVLGYPSGFKQTGLLIGVDETATAGLRDNVSMYQKFGIESNFVDKDQVKNIEPLLDTTSYHSLVYEPRAGYAEPSTTTSSFAHAAEKLGAKVLTQTPVININKTSEGQFDIKTTNGSISARKVILATGVWTNNFLNMLGIKRRYFPLKPARHAVCIFRRPKEFSGPRRPIVFDFLRQTALKPEGVSDLNVSSMEIDSEKEVKDPDSYNESVEFDEVAKYSKWVSEIFPIMSENGKLGATFTGLYDNTPDQQPIIDDLSSQGFENSYCLIGLSGHGFKLSPEFGRIMASLILEETFDDYDIGIFRASRFNTGELIKSNYNLATIG